MEVESTIAVAFIALVGGVMGRAAWNGIKRRNGTSALKSHNDSASAHPDLRKQLGKIEATTLNIHKGVIRIEATMDKLAPEDEE